MVPGLKKGWNGRESCTTAWPPTQPAAFLDGWFRTTTIFWECGDTTMSNGRYRRSFDKVAGPEVAQVVLRAQGGLLSDNRPCWHPGLRSVHDSGPAGRGLGRTSNHSFMRSLSVTAALQRPTHRGADPEWSGQSTTLPAEPRSPRKVCEPSALTRAAELTLTRESRQWGSGPDLCVKAHNKHHSFWAQGASETIPETPNPRPVPSVAKVTLGSAMSVGPCCLYLSHMLPDISLCGHN